MPSLSPLASPSATHAVLAKHGLATKKALGQNFLVNDAVLRKIVSLAELAPDDVVLEVGPGIGTLTIALLKHAAFVVSVERDGDLPAVLAETCAPWAERFALINKDALAVSAADVESALEGLFRRQAPSGAGASKEGAAERPVACDARARLFRALPMAGKRHRHGAEGSCRPHDGAPRNQRLRSVHGEARAACAAGRSFPCGSEQLLSAAARYVCRAAP